MSCYHPLLARYTGSFDGKPQYKVVGQYLGDKYDPRDQTVPCGHCIGCRLDKSRAWADRMMLELDHSKTAVFITLTYDDDNVPIGSFYDDDPCLPIYTLLKEDFQLFMKRLRKYFTGREIRFYACGEYGSTTHRPHYHAILFGLSLEDFNAFPSGKSPHGMQYYASELLSKLWQKKGFVSLAQVSWQTCAYVARYVTKKLNGAASDLYAEYNIIPEFSLMSRRPGIAGYFALDHPDKLDDSLLYIDDPFGLKVVKSVRMPKFLFSKLELINPELYDSIKSQRAEAARDSFLLELSKTDLGEVDYLAVKENNKNVSLKALSRNKI